jgi:hypothetical protein
MGCVIARGVAVQWRRARAAWRGVLAALLVAIAGVGLLAAWQQVTVGDALTPGHMIGMRMNGRMGFVRFTDTRALKAFGIDRGIVFMRCKGRIMKRGDAYNDYYAAGFIRNRLDMQGPLVFARNQRADNELLMADPSRGPFYLYTFHRGTCQVFLDEYVRKGASWRLKPLGRFPASD